MRKKLSSFDSEKDEWYYQPKIYINPKSADPLYDESLEFRSSLSRDLSKKIVSHLDSLLENGNNERKNGKPKRRNGDNSGMATLLKANGKIRRPVISFFSDKAKVIKEELERLNNYLEMRKAIHERSMANIQEDVEALKRFLKEISLYAPGTKHSIDIRRLDLEREVLGLRKELRFSEISLFKDVLFLRNTQREMVFEYQALKRMAELVENGGKNDVAG